MNRSMTASELQSWLRERFPVENERHEWKGWRSLRKHLSADAGDDVLSYASALSNMNGGTLVIGIEDKTLHVTGISDLGDVTPENIKPRLAGLCTHLPMEGLRVEVLRTSDTNRIVWLIHVPRHAPRQPVISHRRAWQRVGDSLSEMRPERLQAILAEPLAGEDWSAQVIPGATLADLDPQALALARIKFAEKHHAERWAHEMSAWNDAQLLDKAKITIHGQITRAALLLLGRPECVAWLSPHPAEISWKVPDERIIKPFGPPFLLNTTELLKHIRNPNIKLFPRTELIATELPRYDTRVILEGLHNCLAHQDYSQAGRIVVEESAGRLKLTNLGGFVDGQPEDYFEGTRTPEIYRNLWLAVAMNNIGMIDKGGYGIRDMVRTQRQRFLPLPDYEGSTAGKTVFNVYGQVIDENFSRLLMERSDLPLEQVIWLDRVQKRYPVEDAQRAQLLKLKLLEGRKPNWHVSANIAATTGSQSEYILNRGFSDAYYKRLMLERLEKFGPASGRQLRDLIWDKLPNILSVDAKETKVKNLRSALRIRGLDGKRIEIDSAGPARGPSAIWRIKRES